MQWLGIYYYTYINFILAHQFIHDLHWVILCCFSLYFTRVIKHDIGTTIASRIDYLWAFAYHYFSVILQICIAGIEFTIASFHYLDSIYVIYIYIHIYYIYIYLTICVALVCWLYPTENKFRLILSNLTLSYRPFPASTHHLDQWHNWHVFESLTQRTNFIGSAPIKIRPFGLKTLYENGVRYWLPYWMKLLSHTLITSPDH